MSRWSVRSFPQKSSLGVIGYTNSADSTLPATLHSRPESGMHGMNSKVCRLRRESNRLWLDQWPPDADVPLIP